jgi:hypothetical protein
MIKEELGILHLIINSSKPLLLSLYPSLSILILTNPIGLTVLPRAVQSTPPASLFAVMVLSPSEVLRHFINAAAADSIIFMIDGGRLSVTRSPSMLSCSRTVKYFTFLSFFERLREKKRRGLGECDGLYILLLFASPAIFSVFSFCMPVGYPG